jgi:hypothetical protein
MKVCGQSNYAHPQKPGHRTNRACSCYGELHRLQIPLSAYPRQLKPPSSPLSCLLWWVRPVSWGFPLGCIGPVVMEVYLTLSTPVSYPAVGTWDGSVKGLVLPHTASWVNPHDLPVPTALRHMLHSISSLVRALATWDRSLAKPSFDASFCGIALRLRV